MTIMSWQSCHGKKTIQEQIFGEATDIASTLSNQIYYHFQSQHIICTEIKLFVHVAI